MGIAVNEESGGSMERIGRLLRLAGLGKGEAILIHKPSNVFYLSGYTGEGLLLIAEGLSAIVTDFRYVEQAQNQAPGWQVHSISPLKGHIKLSAELAAKAGIRTVLYEDDQVTVKQYAAIQQAFEGCQFRPLNQLPEKLRQVKDAGELSHIRRACAISCQAFEQLLPRIKPGMTEKQIKHDLEFTMLALGADGIAFSTIVASGPNGSLPHAIAGDRQLQKGDMITFDFGALSGGYCADMTRTIALGEPDPQMRKIYDIVLHAQKTCQDALAPGKDCKAIDQIARDIIGEAGYGECFGHGLGHAVGIDIHEDPRLSQTANATLEPGIVMTVEPGIYVPGLGGVRIENSCVITQDGAESLVTAPRELIIL